MGGERRNISSSSYVVKPFWCSWLTKCTIPTVPTPAPHRQPLWQQRCGSISPQHLPSLPAMQRQRRQRPLGKLMLGALIMGKFLDCNSTEGPQPTTNNMAKLRALQKRHVFWVVCSRMRCREREGIWCFDLSGPNISGRKAVNYVPIASHSQFWKPCKRNVADLYVLIWRKGLLNIKVCFQVLPRHFQIWCLITPFYHKKRCMPHLPPADAAGSMHLEPPPPPLRLHPKSHYLISSMQIVIYLRGIVIYKESNGRSLKNQDRWTLWLWL